MNHHHSSFAGQANSKISLPLQPQWFFRTQFRVSCGFSHNPETGVVILGVIPRKKSASFPLRAVPRRLSCHFTSCHLLSAPSTYKWFPSFVVERIVINQTTVSKEPSSDLGDCIASTLYNSPSEEEFLLYSVMSWIMASARVMSGKESPAGSSSASATFAIFTIPSTM